MKDLRLRKRHRLRQKEIIALARHIDGALGTKSFGPDDVVDMAEGPQFEVVFVDGRILAFLPDGQPFLTIRGLLKYSAANRYVTVDMGAVKFVYNGADVMGPGVVASDPSILDGDLVWIRDVKNLQPLAIGKSITSAAALARKDKGKVVESIHHVGDKLWLVDEPKERDEEDHETD